MTLRGARAFLIGAAVVLALGTGLTAAVAAARYASAHPATGTRVPGAAGQVRRVVQCGGTMYAVGTFTEISQNGTGYSRDNAFSFSATAPHRITTWAPDVNGTVNSIAVTSNCSDAYIGGSFTSVNGTAADNLVTVWSSDRKGLPGRLSRQGPPVLRWAVYEAGKTHARASAPDHRYYAAVKDRQDGKRAALSEARKILRQACHILAELGDDALTAA
jgi:hypothetical protein